MNKERYKHSKQQKYASLLKTLLPAIYIVIALWCIVFLRLIIESLWDIITLKIPLIINGEHTTWMTTIGFILLLFAMWVCGLFSMILGIRLVKRRTSRRGPDNE